MATGQFFNPPLRNIGRAISSGTFVIPASVSKVFVTVLSARGGVYTSGANNGIQNSGASLAGGGFVEVLPGSTAQITIGAGGTNSTNSGNNGGTTSFDGAITITGSNGSNRDNRYNAGSAGNVGAKTDASSLPTGSPAGAIARVSGATTTGPTGDIANGGSGQVIIYA